MFWSVFYPLTLHGDGRRAPRDGRLEVPLVHDVVAVEHRARPPAAELHDLALRHPGAPELARRRAPQVVHQPAGAPRGPARRAPRLLERAVRDGPPALVEDPRRRHRLAARQLRLEERLERRVRAEREDAALAALRRVRLEAHDPRAP